MSKRLFMSARRLKNLLKRQVISNISLWFNSQVKKLKSIFQEETNRLHCQSAKWGAKELSSMARLGQRIYNQS